MPAVDQSLDRVGDLELAAGRGSERRGDRMDLRAEEVDAGDREVGDGLLRFLDDAAHSAVTVEDGDAERGRLRDALEEDLARTLGAGEGLGIGGDAVLEEVVAEEHAEGIVAEPFPRGDDRVGQTKRGGLRKIGDAGAKRRAVADGRAYLIPGIADDDADVGDAGLRRAAPGRRRGRAYSPPGRAAWRR